MNTTLRVTWCKMGRLFSFHLHRLSLLATHKFRVLPIFSKYTLLVSFPLARSSSTTLFPAKRSEHCLGTYTDDLFIFIFTCSFRRLVWVFVLLPISISSGHLFLCLCHRLSSAFRFLLALANIASCLAPIQLAPILLRAHRSCFGQSMWNLFLNQNGSWHSLILIIFSTYSLPLSLSQW